MKKRVLALMCTLIMAVSMMVGCGTQEEAKVGIEEAAELKVAMLGVDIKTACVILAKELGYFEEEGLNVIFEKVSNLPEGLTAVSQGKLDVLPYGAIPSCSFISQGTDVVIFGGTISEGSEAIVAAGEAESYQTLEAFEGKKIGCFRMETGHMIMKGLLREAGVNAEFIYLDSQASIAEAVAKGEVHVGFVNSGYGYVAKQGGGCEVAFHVGDFEENFPCCRQTTSRESLETKRDALVKYMVAELRAYDVYLNDKETTIKTLAAYSGQEESYVEAVIYGDENYDPAMIVSLDPNKNKMMDFYEVMKGNGDIDAATTYDIADYIDSTVYKDALDIMLERDVNAEVYSQLLTEYEANNN